MLGPELINLAVRPTPIFLEGSPSLRIDQPGPRELGLANFQVVQGLVSIERGQLFINLAGVSQPLLAPDFLKRYLGQQIFFKVQITPDGATILRPVPEPPAAPTPVTANPHLGSSGLFAQQYSGTPASLLQQLMSPESLLARPAPLAAALLGLGVSLSPAMSIEAQIARARELLGRGGVLRLPIAEGVGRDLTLPSVLMRLLGMSTDVSAKERVRGLLSDIDGRQERAVTALRSDVINADILSWVNGAAVELNLQRGPQANAPNRASWVINLYTQFEKNSDVWLRVEHMPTDRIRLDAWLTDPALYLRAADSRTEFIQQVSEFGLHLEHFAVFNQARDTARNVPVVDASARLGERLDSSV